VVRFAERWAEEGFVSIPEGSVAVVENPLPPRVACYVLVELGSLCSDSIMGILRRVRRVGKNKYYF